jgi:hypothetical protein
MLKSIEMSKDQYKATLDNEKMETNKKSNEIENEFNLDNLLLELKIISNIKEFDKICIRKNIEIDAPHLLQSITRKINGDSRDKTISYINDVVMDIFKILDDLLKKEMINENNIVSSSTQLYLNKDKYIQKYNFKDETISVYQKISQNLTQSITGLQNLKITYLNDISTTSKLDMLVVKIQNRISKINNMMVLKP